MSLLIVENVVIPLSNYNLSQNNHNNIVIDYSIQIYEMISFHIPNEFVFNLYKIFLKILNLNCILP